MIFVKGLGVHTPSQADAYLRDLYENYGHIGEQFVRVVASNQEIVKTALIKTLNELEIEGNAESHERFWFTSAAAAITAGEICVMCKWIHYDLAYLRKWFLKVQLPFMRGFVKEQTETNDPVTVLSDYMNYIAANIIRTFTMPGTEPEAKRTNLMDPQVHGDIRAHQHMESGIMHVLSHDFKVYCAKRSRFDQEILKDLAIKGIVTSTDAKQTLGKFTGRGLGQAKCFTVDLRHPLIAATPQVAEIQGKVDSSNVHHLHKVPQTKE
jgi:hypothetical protein